MSIIKTDIECPLEQAEERYRRDPNGASANYNYALVLYQTRQDYDKTEKHFKRALEVAPDYANCHSGYAIFLEVIRKNYEMAEKHYLLSLEYDTKDEDSRSYASRLRNYAIFLEVVNKDYDQAEEHYKRALEIRPDDADILCDYAIFLHCIRKDYKKAEAYYKRAKQTLGQECDVNVEMRLCKYCTVSHDSTAALVWLDRLDKAGKSLRGQLLYYFFRFVLEPDKRDDHAHQIDTMLNDGVRDEEGTFGRLLNCDHIKNDPDYDTIKEYAERINEPFQKTYPEKA